MTRKPGCIKIQEMADQWERERVQQCPYRRDLYKKEQARKRKEKIAKGLQTTRTVFSEIDRVINRLSGAPAKKTVVRKRRRRRSKAR